MTWTKFHDMHSGGGLKQKPFKYIYIEGGHADAVETFMDVFNDDPNRIACQCCGANYSITEYGSLREATQYERKGYRHDGTYWEYQQRDDVAILLEDGTEANRIMD